MNSTVLSEILRAVEIRLIERKSRLNLESLKKLIHRKPQDFASCFLTEKASTSVIAEIKFRSPSGGLLREEKNPKEIASDYLAGGARALSILTEQDFFGGNLDYLKIVRSAHPNAFILMKDFIIDEYQIYEGLIGGADCILLILAALGQEKTKKFLNLASELGLSTLVEVHNEEEMRLATKLEAKIIGINNRDLKTLKTSLDVSRNLIKIAPKNSILICESGIERPEEIREMKELGFKGFLVGTSLMRSLDPGKDLRKLIEMSS